MQLIEGHAAATPAQRGAVLALGNFDGVHLGHRALIDAARRLAGPTGRAGVMTFTPHPLALLAPAAAPRPITSLARRWELLAAAGCDVVVCEPFTADLAACDATTFIDDVLVDALGVAGVVVGPDFAFGAGRSGNAATLRARGLAVEEVAPVIVDGAPASSSRVRAALAAGELAPARSLLGRRWDVDGVVVHGAKRGRAIGVPTANVAPHSALLLPLGIYVVWLDVDGRRLPGVASLGTNPTFVDDGATVLEVHVLDFDGDLYDRTARVTFLERLRGEVRYEGIEPLLAQIRRDIDDARAIFRRNPTP